VIFKITPLFFIKDSKMANRTFTQFFNTLHKGPVLIDCNFIIDSTNGNGLGLRSLKGPGISQVFGYSTSPISGNNLAQGYYQIFFQDNYYRYFGGFSGFVAPVSTSVNISSGLSVGTTYVIVSVGTSTAANWQAVGLSPYITPAVGVSFVASSSSAGTGTGVVQTPTATGSKITDIEVVGDPNTTLNSNPYGNGYIIVRTMAPVYSGTGPAVNMAVTQPADNSTFGLSFYLSNSSVIIQGE
jgi:hypothetical protein